MGGERPTAPGSLFGTSACCELVRSINWSMTPLGPRSSWSARLLATTNLVLGSPHPMILFWGSQHVQLYNDAFVPSLGPGRHPEVMGQRARDCWPEAWPTLGRLLEEARGGTSGHRIDHLIPIWRAGRMEEAFWTYSYSPAHDDDGSVGGTLLVCTETTARVVAERRVRTLRALGARLGEATTGDEVAPSAIEVLRGAMADVPFAAAYEIDGDGRLHLRAMTAAIGDEALAALGAAVSARSREVVDLPPLKLDGAAWPEPIVQAFVTPARTEALVFGLAPRRPFDASYKDFLEHLADTASQARERIRAREIVETWSTERERLLAAAETASRAKDEFLAMLGHELRNPLAPITTALHLMKLKDPTALEREREIIARQAAHLVKLVDDLLDVARVARGKVTLTRTRVPLGDIIARAVETASPVFEQKRHVLTVDVSVVSLDVEADALRLGQVFANLLTNAAKYTEPDGRIAVRAWRENDVVVARVEDNGVGIPPALLPHLFDAFFQGPRSPDRAQGGLGLGLALVKSFVSLHGGTVTATSREGGGSIFEVRLPALPVTDERKVEPAVELAEPAARPREKGRVLLVDDSDDILELIASLLRHEGYEVLAMHDAPSALRAAPVFRPNVAVLDIGLPAMDGYELAHRLREVLGEGAPRLIAMTGYGQEADRERARVAGFAAHLVKPVDPRELLARVRS